MITREQAVTEAARCLMCHEAPCERACPAAVAVTTFIRRLRFGDFGAALRKILDANVLAGTCGMTCPEGLLCEEACVLGSQGRPIRIRDLQLSAHLFGTGELPLGRIGPAPGSGPPKVAVVGGGPSGVACGHNLMRLGIDVVLYEKDAALGGMLARGIPQYRISRDVVAREIEWALRGIDVVTEASPDRITWADLKRRGYSAVFLATGLWEMVPPGLEGSDLEGVFEGTRLLAQMASGDSTAITGGRVAVVGGGNTACDVALSLKRYAGCDVTVYYRRTREDMPAFPHEVSDALVGGVRFEFLTAPVAVKGIKRVETLVLRRMVPGLPDKTGRKAPVAVGGSDFSVDCDHVVLATGATLDREWLRASFGVAVGDSGRVTVNPETLMTGIEGVFAGGDLVREKGLVVEAVADGRKAAGAIARYLGVIQ